MTEEQHDHFEARGFVRLRGVFARDAAAMEERVWQALGRRCGARRAEPETWPRGSAEGLQFLKRQAVFDAIGGPVLRGALDALLGAGVWLEPKDWGQVLVTFPSAGESTARSPWHTDFDFRGPPGRVFGALVFSYLCDVPPGAGGTLAVAGSHRLIRRFALARAGRLGRMKTVRHAFMRSDPWLAALAAEESAARLDRASLPGPRDLDGVPAEVVELAGEAGDVVIGHPWLLHRTAPNLGERPRMMRVQRIQTSAVIE
jgi:hypothetical protein